MDSISKKLEKHYTEKFTAFGPTPQGVDWGPVEADTLLRYAQMLRVMEGDEEAKPSLLDVGCGYGGLLLYANNQKVDIAYTGIDMAENMIAWAKENLGFGATFMVGNFLEVDFDQTFDYVVCNGILTQKLDTSNEDMDAFSKNLIQKMFASARKGVAFNTMTSKVNYFADNLYYKDPAELIAWCMENVTSQFRVNHAYKLYEYTMYLYRGAV